MGAVLVKNADRMMTSASLLHEGIEVVFADGRRGLIPFSAIPEVGDLANMTAIDIPNPYEIILHCIEGEAVELPWDFVRHYCDDSYRPRVESISAMGRQALGERVRQSRLAAGMTQDRLARAAGIGRVTLVRIEQGEQSPRYETLTALASALGRSVSELVSSQQTFRE
jgi:DNA-binding XRE family transcriptional regulator